MLIAGDIRRIADLRQGAVVGTSALRRRAQLLHLRPDLQIVNLRGNVDTRLAKREAGIVEATVLALAGLKRLGMAHVGTPVPEDEMLPAVGQGAVCIECRADDAETPRMARRHRSRADRDLRGSRARHAGRARRLVPHADRRSRRSHNRRRTAFARPDRQARRLGADRHRTARRGSRCRGDRAATPEHELKRRGGPGFLST